MKECHVCFFMCDDKAELCPVCGAELGIKDDEKSDEAVNESENTENTIKTPVLAASVDSPVTAEIFADILSENGIAYSMDERGDLMHSGFGGSYFALDVYVDEEDLDIAKELYKNLSENEFSFEDFDSLEDSGEI